MTSSNTIPRDLTPRLWDFNKSTVGSWCSWWKKNSYLFWELLSWSVFSLVCASIAAMASASSAARPPSNELPPGYWNPLLVTHSTLWRQDSYRVVRASHKGGPLEEVIERSWLPTDPSRGSSLPPLTLELCSVHGSDGKASAYNAWDLGLIPGSGRSSGEGNGSTLQYSNTLAWKIPWTEEPGRLQSMGSQRVGHD